MKNRIFLILGISLCILNCQKRQNPFEISINRIGLLTKEIQIKQLDSVFVNDSVVTKSIGGEFSGFGNQIEVYEKGGAKLLVLEAKKEADSTSTIRNIQIIDSRYKTASGLSTNSVFKDIKDHYTISKVNNTLSTAVIFADSIQAYFTIDKKELPQKFRYNTDIKIEASDIPDAAKVKYFWISWEDE